MHSREGDRGSALLLAVVVVVIIVGVGGAFLTENIYRARQSMLETQMDDGQRLINAALDQVRRFMFVYKTTNSWTWDDILAYNQNFPTDPYAIRDEALAELRKHMAGTSLYTNASTWPEAPVPADHVNPANPGAVSSLGREVFGRFYFYGKGVWYVTIRDNADEVVDPNIEFPPGNDWLHDKDNQVLVFITVVMPDGVMRQSEALIFLETEDFKQKGAVTSGGPVWVFGNTGVRVSSSTPDVPADVLSNRNILLQGNVTVDGYAKAGGNTDTQGSVNIGTPQRILNGQTIFDLPQGKPENFVGQATIQLLNGGFVKYRATVNDPWVAGNQIGTYYGFKYKNGKWTLSQSPSSPGGVYYIETDLSASGHPNLQGATLMVNGSIDWSANPTGATGTDIAQVWGGIALFAGQDIQLSGTMTIEGIVIAHEQIDIGGNITINGGVVAVDAVDTPGSLVQRHATYSMSLSGNLSVNATQSKPTPLPLNIDTATLIWVRKKL
jgi:type II secretory pathway pseudopilin PulG